MKSEYVLLCSPYRYNNVLSNEVNKQFIEKELINIMMPGVNIVTRNMIKTMLEENYGIVDYSSLKNEIDNLEKGNYYAIKLEKLSAFIDAISTPSVKDFYTALNELTNSSTIKGFDDCRIIDVLTKSYAARLITKPQFDEIFTKQTERIKNNYQTWEQYLASCVLGKLLQFVDASNTITSDYEYVTDIYSFCIAPTNVFSYGTFWLNHDLTNLTVLLEKILPAETKNIKSLQNLVNYNDKIPSLNAPSNELIAYFDETYTDTNLIDYDRFNYLNKLAEYVLWEPLVANNLEWMITEKNLKEQDALLLPSEFASYYSASEFWSNYNKYTELHEEHIFAMFKGVFNINVIFTEKAVYTFKKKLFGKPELIKINWDQVNFNTALDLELGTCEIRFDKQLIFDVYPAINDINLNDNVLNSLNSQERKAIEIEWQQKMNDFLKNISKRISEFKQNNI